MAEMFLGLDAKSITVNGESMIKSLTDIIADLFECNRTPGVMIFGRKWFKWRLQARHSNVFTRVA